MRSFPIAEGQEYFPSNFTPDLVISIIKDYIAHLPYTSRNIILFNYPSADMRPQTDNETFYPRAADEFFEIEKQIGNVKVFLEINSRPMVTEIDDPVQEQKKIVEKKVVKKKINEDEDEDLPEEDEEEKKKKQFNPLEYKWTLSNGRPKALTQVFNKMRNVNKVTPFLTPSIFIGIN